MSEITPIPLTDDAENQVKLWAADDRLWTTQETVEFNLRTFARVILKTNRGINRPRPTIAELEAILKSNESLQIVTNPDGSINAIPTDLATARADLENCHQQDRMKTREINVLVQENRELRKHLQAVTGVWMEQRGRVFEGMGEQNPRACAIDKLVEDAVAYCSNPSLATINHVH